MLSHEKTPIPDLKNELSTNPKKQANYLLDKIENSIEYVQKKRIRYQTFSGSLKIIVLILSGIVTVLLGIRWDQYSEELRNIAFVIGATVTVFSSLDLYFNFRSLWVEHEEAKWRLNRLKDRVEFYLAGTEDDKIDAGTISEFHESYQWIWDNLSTNWLYYRKKEGIE